MGYVCGVCRKGAFLPPDHEAKSADQAARREAEKAAKAEAEKTGARVSFWGDKDQLPAVSAGTPFSRLIAENKVKFAEMTEIVRQENAQYKSAVYDIIGRDF